jgi:hypothetical protein
MTWRSHSVSPSTASAVASPDVLLTDCHLVRPAVASDYDIGYQKIQLIVLDLEHAKLTHIKAEKSLAPAAKDALVFYLKEYLRFLKHAGHHIMYSLPDFDDDYKRLRIDYSELRAGDIKGYATDAEVWGISIEWINQFVNARW